MLERNRILQAKWNIAVWIDGSWHCRLDIVNDDDENLDPDVYYEYI